MVLLLSLFLAAFIVLCGKKTIRTHTTLIYILCAFLSILSGAALYLQKASEQDIPGYLSSVILSVFTKGGLACALFAFVMFAGAVSNGSSFRKTVLPLRGELSIMASILAAGHIVFYGSRYFLLLFTQAADLQKITLIAALSSFLLLLLLIPLFITSFRRIRRRMKARTWKRLQRSAYGFYALLYLHILFFNMRPAGKGQPGAILNVVLYSILFLSYGYMRIAKALRKNTRDYLLLPLRFAAVFCAACVLAGFLVPLYQARNVQASSGQQMDASASADSGAAAVEEAATGTSAGNPDTAPDASSAQYKDGKYTGAAIGYNGRLTVSVTIEDGVITDAHMKGSVDDEPYITDACAVFDEIVAQNNTLVDAVSGATTSSHALTEAVEDALSKAAAEQAD
ncbi:MAG: FMN-binding protein [Blautia sp.]|nr:FMN-binding protein [Blautia sp.]